MERTKTLAMLKPLGTQEPMRHEVLALLSNVATIVYTRQFIMSQEVASQIYYPSGHDPAGNKLPHFDAIVNYLSGKLVEAMIITSEDNIDVLIEKMDAVIGHWQPEKTTRGQIRNLPIVKNIPYVFPVDTPAGSNKTAYDNLIHSSDSAQSATRELNIIFTSEEIAQT